MTENTARPLDGGDNAVPRRDFLLFATAAAGVGWAAAAAWPFVRSLGPAADTMALASLEIDLSPIETGQAITVMWRGKPVFIRHRTQDEIDAAAADDGAALSDPQTDAERVQNPEWLVAVGICTHLGCIPQGQRAGDAKGEYGGWFCSCHGSHFDASGRIRKGPAPTNLAVPPYTFIDDTTLKIG